METFGSNIAAMHLLLFWLRLVSMLHIGEAGETAWMQADLLLDIQNVFLCSENIQLSV